MRVSVISRALVLCFGALASYGAPLSFLDGFDSVLLGPEWTTQAGAGVFSLTDRPGFLRYELTGSTNPNGDNPALWIYRPFDGIDWVLNTKAEYNIPAGNGRQLFVRVLLGDLGAKGVNEVFFFRDKDFGRDNIVVGFFDGGISEGFASAPADLFYFEVLRNGQEITILGSTDGITFMQLATRNFATTLGGQQTLLVSGASFASGQGGTADYDFFSVNAVPEPGSLTLLGLGLVGCCGALRRKRSGGQMV